MSLPEVVVELVHAREGLVAVGKHALEFVRLVVEHVATVIHGAAEGGRAALRASQDVVLGPEGCIRG